MNNSYVEFHKNLVKARELFLDLAKDSGNADRITVAESELIEAQNDFEKAKKETIKEDCAKGQDDEVKYKRMVELDLVEF